MRYKITYTGIGKKSFVISNTEKLVFTDGTTLECEEDVKRLVESAKCGRGQRFTFEAIEVKDIEIPKGYSKGITHTRDKRQRDILEKDPPMRTLANVIEDKRRSAGLN